MPWRKAVSASSGQKSTTSKHSPLCAKTIRPHPVFLWPLAFRVRSFQIRTLHDTESSPENGKWWAQCANLFERPFHLLCHGHIPHPSPSTGLLWNGSFPNNVEATLILPENHFRPHSVSSHHVPAWATASPLQPGKWSRQQSPKTNRRNTPWLFL